MAAGQCGGGGCGGVVRWVWVETIKPLLLESFVRQMSAGRPVLFKRLLSSVLLVSRLLGKEKKKEKGICPSSFPRTIEFQPDFHNIES